MKAGHDRRLSFTLEIALLIHLTNLAAVFQLLQPLLQCLQPLLVPLCFLSAWSIVGLLGWSVWTTTRDTVDRGRQMHRIPCANCQFFTRDYHLKCTVRPYMALTEAAISCPDYEPVPNAYTSKYPTSYSSEA